MPLRPPMLPPLPAAAPSATGRMLHTSCATYCPSHTAVFGAVFLPIASPSRRFPLLSSRAGDPAHLVDTLSDRLYMPSCRSRLVIPLTVPRTPAFPPYAPRYFHPPISTSCCSAHVMDGFPGSLPISSHRRWHCNPAHPAAHRRRFCPHAPAALQRPVQLAARCIRLLWCLVGYSPSFSLRRQLAGHVTPPRRPAPRLCTRFLCFLPLSSNVDSSVHSFPAFWYCLSPHYRVVLAQQLLRVVLTNNLLPDDSHVLCMYICCMAVNLQLVLIHGVNGSKMERYYLLAAAFSAGPVTYHHW
ncbi:hypothetical protein B0H13DRAFT_2653956 [Mycena leptocephala]|nr:hypothetical protein B0H13DRAFT_2653956 [Mycena leptocephala]